MVIGIRHESVGRAEDFGVKLWSGSWKLGEPHTPLML